mgnify:CR=1 FL=1
MRKKNVRFDNLKFIDSALSNDDTYFDYLRRMKMVALSMFEWVNLPKGMDSRFLEEVLYYNGLATLLYDEEYGFINTASTPSGALNIYGLPTEINCFSYGFSSIRKLYTGLANEEARKTNCILVLNNQDKESTFSDMELFAYRMYKAERSSDININATKSPIVILANDKTKLSMVNAYAQYDGNQPVIVGKKGQFDLNDISSIDTKAEFIADKLQDYKKSIWNELLTFLGINNLNEKKERMVTDETNQNNEVINLNLQSFLIPRKEACKQFNELFGLTGENEISVRVRSDLQNTIKKMESIVSDYNSPDDDEKEISEEEGVEV